MRSDRAQGLRALALVRVVAALALVPRLAEAAPDAPTSSSSPSARAESDRLFREGKKLYDAGKLKEACDALAKSDELDPAIGTLGLLASCHEKRGDLVTAWKAYLETARRAEVKRDSRGEYATQQAEALKARLGWLTVRSLGQEPGLEVTRDDKAMLGSELGAEMPVNPGAHSIAARAPDTREWRTSFTLKEGERRAVEVPALESLGSPFPPRWLAWAVGGVGVAGIGVGIASGTVALSENSASNDPSVCAPTARMCDPRDTALTAATVSTVAFSVGVAALAAGTVLYVLSMDDGPKAAAQVRIAPTVSSGEVGALLVGTF